MVDAGKPRRRIWFSPYGEPIRRAGDSDRHRLAKAEKKAARKARTRARLEAARRSTLS